MYPDTISTLAKLKIEEELAWADRQRRARLARGDTGVDAVAFSVRLRRGGERLRDRGRRLVGGFTGLGQRPAGTATGGA